MSATQLLFRDDAYARACEAGVLSVTPDGVVLDRTVFYAQGGGQPGDVGALVREDGTEVAVTNTVYGPDRTTNVHLITGGAIGDGDGRLDFDIPEAGLDKAEIAEKLNALIARDAPVGERWITDAELDANPGLVKTMSVKPPRGAGRVRLVEIEGIDLQPCVGTHVRRTGEIGAVVVTDIEKKGKQNRRVRIALA